MENLGRVFGIITGADIVQVCTGMNPTWGSVAFTGVIAIVLYAASAWRQL